MTMRVKRKCELLTTHTQASASTLIQMQIIRFSLRSIYISNLSPAVDINLQNILLRDFAWLRRWRHIKAHNIRLNKLINCYMQEQSYSSQEWWIMLIDCHTIAFELVTDFDYAKNYFNWNCKQVSRCCNENADFWPEFRYFWTFRKISQ